MPSLLGIAAMYYPEGGGGELATHLHYKALVKHGWRVSVIAYTFNSKYPIREIIDGVTVYRIPSPVPRELVHQYVATKIDPPAMKLIKKLLNKSDIAHIAEHVYSAIPYIKSLSCKPIVAHVHDHSPICYCGAHYNYIKRRNCNGLCTRSDIVSCISGRRITKLLYQRGVSRVTHLFTIPLEIPAAIYVSRKRRENLLQADIIITVSKTLAKELHCLIPESGIKVITVYNPLPEVGKYVRPYDTGRRTLLYAGGSTYEKGIFHLPKIWKLLVKRYKNLELCVAGGLDSLTLRHIVEKYKLTSTVKLLPRVAHEEVMRLLMRVDAAVVPSLGSEGLPYAVIEPMTAGRAVFASPVGGIPEILRDGYGGYFIDPWDSNGSADVLAKIVDFEEMVRQGKYAKKHITRLLTHEKTTGRLATIFAKII